MSRQKRKLYRLHLLLSLSLVYGCQIPGTHTSIEKKVDVRNSSSLPKEKMNSSQEQENVAWVPKDALAPLLPIPPQETKGKPFLQEQTQNSSSYNPNLSSPVIPSPAPVMPTISPDILLYSPTEQSEFQVLSQAEITELQSNPLITVNNKFAASLFHELSQDKQENLFISPASVSLAFLMVWNGAAGETQTEMQKSLQIEGMDPEQVNRWGHLLMRKMLKPAEDIQLEVANAIWANDRFTLLPEYIEKNQNNFLTKITNEHFINGLTQSKINEWAKQRTHGKIPTVLNPIDDPQTAKFWEESTFAILLNALYFKANWTHRFESFETQSRNFTLDNGSQKTVPMMKQFDYYKYLPPNSAQFKNKFQAIQIPYGKQSTLGMYIFLPEYGASLASIQSNILENISNPTFFKAFYDEGGELLLPKFKFKSHQDLVKPLKNLGMKLAFDQNLADFTKMAQTKSPDQHFYISDAFQKSNIEVNEEGTEASAVTVINFTSDIGSSGPVRQLSMVCNHPFMYLIRDNETGQILFMGNVYDPSQEI
ncbi:hypothetical protein COW36_08935 [bacterium (Candidatus Blackallbacteria) CG17_big_fil_post_rev_8_21_14_2_50_48_46]|uniref:Serpin domain-containing protein n=1 Tax=bacterium (Candidatus Blackallbacteria) CG17_big_fil_post_rev_8_21_14_2_50_48_46 TaxID=2014261 RepID=A0A2M7G5J5_9BACT|nr:MAG: hypothetical protein COW64_24115 [bacterium (Candidatus Blackallbacteria) CG18_big_fil_WC_8_21_14_2_50_49_26]PIW17293.1 MAG: hypothetical protein COW36_08935 [bacterium (Candidatus Blackallbacteria) CG17_big_fil_post_rev_8_21_14_2_50_48_46]PIW47476.1 MAG: hypothetical protein COW20_12895 [bacterium (Candidatus Blackallbacteria) CG13_big_fil_rev_8_21_14_2_50_49_14]